MKKTTIIGIAGGTASGKTTIANKVYEASKPFGSVAYIKLDDYYKDLTYLEQEFGQAINFDHPDAYDSKRLVEDLLKLKSGKTIYKPTYDFVPPRMDNSENHPSKSLSKELWFWLFRLSGNYWTSRFTSKLRTISVSSAGWNGTSKTGEEASNPSSSNTYRPSVQCISLLWNRRRLSPISLSRKAA